jgi:DNA-binding response OmpR family regulator
MTARPLLLIGVPDRKLLPEYIRAALRAGVETEVVAAPAEIDPHLENRDLTAVVVEMRSQGAEGACLLVRAVGRFAGLPILGLTPELTDLAFSEMYGWGGDDVIRTSSPDDLVPRLRGISGDPPHISPVERGAAVIADGDRRRRILYGRVLRNAGYDVRFAVDPVETVVVTTNSSPALAVIDANLGDKGGVDVVQQIRAEGSAVPIILLGAPKKLLALRIELASLPKVMAMDGFAPPENLLFVANELQRAGQVDGRTSARVLYTTVVAFRLEGRDEDTLGCTYNISAGGLYVRTLAPLVREQVAWIELRPPRCDRRVRLEGKVVWSRPFGPVGSATVPPGFAIQITDGTKRDRETYETGYRSFCADTSDGA